MMPPLPTDAMPLVLEPLAACRIERGALAWIPDELWQLSDAVPWGSYVATTPSGSAVGACAFKAPPDTSGLVEIAFLTRTDCRRRGVANKMVARLCEIAFAEQRVAGVLAHTLPRSGPSPRVLAAQGFAHVGMLHDDEDGPVWRWRRDRT